MAQSSEEQGKLAVLIIEDHFVRDLNRCFLPRLKEELMRDAALQDGD